MGFILSRTAMLWDGRTRTFNLYHQKIPLYPLSYCTATIFTEGAAGAIPSELLKNQIKIKTKTKTETETKINMKINITMTIKIKIKIRSRSRL